MFFVVVFCINTQTDQNRADRIYFNDEKKNMDLVEKIFVSGCVWSMYLLYLLLEMV